MTVGTPTSNVRGNRLQLKAGDKEAQLAGHYVMLGIIDMHGHIGGAEQSTPAEYLYKLWL